MPANGTPGIGVNTGEGKYDSINIPANDFPLWILTYAGD
jgi:hypothetical protein